MKHVPVNPTTIQSDLSAYEREIDSNTILLLASAPSYPQVRSVNFFVFILVRVRVFSIYCHNHAQLQPKAERAQLSTISMYFKVHLPKW